MPRRRGQPSIYTVSFLDVIAATFATILLVYVLLLARLERQQSQALEGRFVVLAVRVVGLDDQGKADPAIQVHARLEVLLPPRGRPLSEDPPATLPEDWGTFALPYEKAGLEQAGVGDVKATANGPFVYCVLRGVNPDMCLLRLSFYATAGEAQLRRIRLEGWLASPAGGKRPLSAVAQRPLSVDFTSDSSDPRALEFVRTDRWLEAALVVHANLRTPDPRRKGADR